MNYADLPASAPQDGVMATRTECEAMQAWAARVFAGEAIPGSGPAPLSLEVRRQGFSTLHFRRSCLDTPLRIGEQDFARGLGTHANSEIAVALPAGAVRFEAFAGIDNNHDTRGQFGSVVCSVEADGTELLRTPVLRGGDAPYAVPVDLPAGARELVLKVDTTPDGPSHDQTDWADAQIVLADGARIHLDEGHDAPLLSAERPPLSFIYGGRSSTEFLSGWRHEAREIATDADERRAWQARWTDPDTGLIVAAELTVYRDYPAADWVVSFENAGSADTPILEDIQALDLSLLSSVAERAVTIGHNVGDVFGERSFANEDEALTPCDAFAMAPQGGRSSNGAFPFFDVRYGDRTIIAAIGWSGQWRMEAKRGEDGATRLRAGIERTHLTLHPGERIRMPRILLTLHAADPVTAHNRFRRLMLHQYVPQQDGRPVLMPISLACFDRYSWTVPEWATEKGQLEGIAVAADLGFDTYWFDAAWFPGGFPNGVGNWIPKPEAFPNGLRPLGEATRRAGLRFILWFEPERVAPDTAIAREHPEFVHGEGNGGLFRLDDPEARAWLTDLLSERIKEGGVDIYRNDFNVDPLAFWRGNDAEDRQGMTEIRYVEGLYEMWDALIARHPGLIIDNCASGGRRIDLELCMRSVPLWRSDTNCFPGNADWNPGHTAGISYYLPLHTASAWEPVPYEVRAALTTGLVCQWPYLDADFPREQAKAVLEEAKALQKYCYGDLYPVMTTPVSPTQWCAFQWHRADLDEGALMCFRRAKSPYVQLDATFEAVDPEGFYEIELRGESGPSEFVRLTGAELRETGVSISLDQPASSFIVLYRRVNEQ